MPISKDNTQFHAAYQDIKQKILSGFFSSDARLREMEISKLIGMGRTPVREALKRLEDERLLTHEPRRGLVITRIDKQGVTELYAMREVLEGAAAEFAARHATDAEIDNMQSILEQSEQPDSDPVRMNLQFHEAIYGAAHNQHLIRTLQSISDTTFLLGRSTLQSPQRAQKAVAEHQQILAAIRDRDPEAASIAAKNHIRQAFLERLKMLRDAD
ncbi:GntR family transcriptional regulator [Advenella kashmirensis WT001]|uniref:GntR family transcriptional regulator n=1 Tax=Advenella kashmirensis (strain DSM 17095 / LMG 22695 / WT001) TaxID=1036672 RepID=I3UGC9_ADVKW|nr:GntR family transcriptional regulator [Advenella kashmirensis]AFK64067.1 GntR family transcriptional regulator [Advenella kashmirensis WT001]